MPTRRPSPKITFSDSFGPTNPNRKRWTRKDCEFLERTGLLSGRYELLDGEIIEKMGQNQPHAITVTLLVKWLIAIFGGDFIICQLPVEVARNDQRTNYVEPDAALLLQAVTNYPQDAPGPGEVRTIFEVSDTTLRDDLNRKALLYGRAGFPEHVVLDVTSRRAVVHQQPSSRGYAVVFALTEDDTLALLAAPNAAVTLTDLLPPAPSAGE